MTDLTAVALHGDASDLYELLEQRRAQERKLKLEILRKEAELRRAVEEQALVKELHEVNKMTVLQRQQNEVSDTSNRLKIGIDSMEEIAVLENEIKHESGRTSELQDCANSIARQMEEVEKGIEDITSRVALVKKATEGENSIIGGFATLNEWLLRKKSLTALHDEQKTVKAITTLLSERIEFLTNELNVQKENEDKLAAAREVLLKKTQQHNELLEQLKSMERLTKKKERLLDTAANRRNNDYGEIKRLEGDKKVLYSTLSKFRETNASNTKSILSLGVRLTHLEAKLDGINQFLQQVFVDVEEGAMKDVPEDATEVPLRQFEELCRNLDVSRETLHERDSRLNSYDAKIEQLDNKVCIFQNAIASRVTSAQLDVKAKEKEFEALMSHVDYMKAEFEEEYTRLTRENASLRAKLVQIQ